MISVRYLLADRNLGTGKHKGKGRQQRLKYFLLFVLLLQDFKVVGFKMKVETKIKNYENEFFKRYKIFR